jgi:hypothetical protein
MPSRAPRCVWRSLGGYVDAHKIESGDALLDRVGAMLHGLGARR